MMKINKKRRKLLQTKKLSSNTIIVRKNYLKYLYPLAKRIRHFVNYLEKYTIDLIIKRIENYLGLIFLKSIDLKQILNTNKIHLEYLHTLTKRWRRFVRRLKGYPVNPAVFKILTEDSSKYKLFRAEKEESTRFKDYLTNYHTLSHLDFIPKLIYFDARHMILEYIDGPFPDVTSYEFSKEFGRCLGLLHNVGVSYLSSKEVLSSALEDLHNLVTFKIIDCKMADSIYEKIESILPFRIRTSMTYTDLKKNSFCYDANGRLIFLDIGSFQSDRITDDFLIRSKLFQKINLKVFTGEYLANGGLRDLLDRGIYLKPLNDITMAAYITRRIAQTSKLQLRRYRKHQRDLQERIKFLVDFLSGKDQRNSDA